jgi:hypothetical protein
MHGAFAAALPKAAMEIAAGNGDTVRHAFIPQDQQTNLIEGDGTALFRRQAQS